MKTFESLLEEYHIAIVDLAADRVKGETRDRIRVSEALVSTTEQTIINHVTSLVEAAKKEGGENG